MTTAWVPCDAAAVSVGADDVALALEASGASVRRNGSRGMLWLEPLVEVETAAGRVGYANVTASDVADLLEGVLDDTDRCVGVVDEHPWLAGQHRVSFARVGVIEPTDITAYRQLGGFAGLERALRLSPEQVVAEVTASGLRGRGGAGFPAGIKWETVRTASADVKFVCCNADEGDSGTFADRMLIEGDPFTLIEGMAIAAVAVGADRGIRLPALASTRTRSARCVAPSTSRTRTGSSASRCSAAAGASTSTCGWAPVPTSAARRPRCSSPSRASAARCAPSHRSPRSPDSSAARPSSTTS